MINKRAIAFFRILAQAKDYVTAEALSEQIGSRPRTLREDLRQARSRIERDSGAVIESKSNQGYRLVIKDEHQFYRFLQHLLREEAKQQFLMPVLQEDRINYIVRYFIAAHDYVKSEDLADEMHVSRSTFSGDLKIVKERLADQGLSLESKVGQGMKIAGDELKIRAAIAKYYFHQDNTDASHPDLSYIPFFDQQQKTQLSDIVYAVIKKYRFKLTDYGFQNLVIHILIAMHRIQEGIHSTDSKVNVDELSQKDEWKLAEEIAGNIEKDFSVQIPNDEIAYITIHLLGKKVFGKEDNQVISTTTLNLVRDIFQEIMLKFNVDFFSDIELYTMLSLHVQPMLSRIEYGLHLHNPLAARIKEENPMAFEMAVLAGEVLSRKYYTSIDESELAYLALHFQLAIQRNAQKEKKNILVICASGAGTSQILLYKVQQNFKEMINRIEVMNAFQLQDIDQSVYDFILSTIPLGDAAKIPVIQVQYHLDEGDVENIRRILMNESEAAFVKAAFSPKLFFTNQNFSTKEEVIHFLCEEMNKIQPLPAEFEALVYQREALASTALGAGIAIPHPSRLLLDETRVAFCQLSKPIDWSGKAVNLVFLMGVKKDADEAFTLFNRVMTHLIHQTKSIQRLKHEIQYDDFIRLIEEICSIESKQVSQSIFE